MTLLAGIRLIKQAQKLFCKKKYLYANRGARVIGFVLKSIGRCVKQVFTLKIV